MQKTSLKQAMYLLCEPQGNDHSNVELVKIEYVGFEGISQKYFHYRQLRYIWENSKFIVSNFDTKIPCEQFYSKYGMGHSHESYTNSIERYGKNLMQIPVRSYGYLIVNEALHPFYIFQIFSMLIWYLDFYYGN